MTEIKKPLVEDMEIDDLFMSMTADILDIKRFAPMNYRELMSQVTDAPKFLDNLFGSPQDKDEILKDIMKFK